MGSNHRENLYGSDGHVTGPLAHEINLLSLPPDKWNLRDIIKPFSGLEDIRLQDSK